MTCSFPGCDRLVRCKGLCASHYQQQRTGRPLTPIVGRGFAGLSPDRQRELAARGGRAAHEKGTAHRWTATEAASAGARGGVISAGQRNGWTPDRVAAELYRRGLNP